MNSNSSLEVNSSEVSLKSQCEFRVCTQFYIQNISWEVEPTWPLCMCTHVYIYKFVLYRISIIITMIIQVTNFCFHQVCNLVITSIFHDFLFSFTYLEMWRKKILTLVTLSLVLDDPAVMSGHWSVSMKCDNLLAVINQCDLCFDQVHALANWPLAIFRHKIWFQVFQCYSTSPYSTVSWRL